MCGLARDGDTGDFRGVDGWCSSTHRSNCTRLAGGGSRDKRDTEASDIHMLRCHCDNAVFGTEHASIRPRLDNDARDRLDHYRRSRTTRRSWERRANGNVVFPCHSAYLARLANRPIEFARCPIVRTVLPAFESLQLVLFFTNTVLYMPFEKYRLIQRVDDGGPSDISGNGWTSVAGELKGSVSSEINLVGRSK